MRPTFSTLATTAARRAALLVAVASMLLGCGDAGDSPKPPEPVRPSARSDAPPRTAAETISPPSIPAPHASDDPSDPRNWRLSGSDDNPMLVQIGGLHSRKPASWPWQQPTMRFRSLQYTVPGRDGGGAGELILSLFMSTESRPTRLNIDRWNRQFTDAEGAPTTPVQERRLETTIPTLFVEHHGGYIEMGAAAARGNHRQLAAVVEAPGRRVFVRLVGPDATVEANRAAFMEMVQLFREVTVPLPGSPAAGSE
jgi:hypothetical protein